MRQGLLIILILSVTEPLDGFCYPGEKAEECLQRLRGGTDDNNEETKEDSRIELRVRGEESYKEFCRVNGSSSYQGACEYPNKCRLSSYAYSPTCGLGGLVCCKGSKSKQRTKVPTTKLPRTTRRPYVLPQRQDETSLKRYENEVCGVSGARATIFNGTKVDKGEFPFMASFVYRNGISFCGGVLITRRHILTAAHCFDHEDWKMRGVDVRIGQSDLDDNESPNTNANILNVKVRQSL